MRISVLGPLRVVADGREVPLSAGRQRAVLAALALRANRVVPTDGLVDSVWGQHAPGSARRLVQTYVWRLRGLLGHCDAAGRPGRIVSYPEGYSLHVGPDELDARVFERMAAQGQGALAAGDAQEASSCLTDALALWSGEPLAGTRVEGSLAAELTRLTELRRKAFATRIEADLRLGRHADVIAEMSALVASDPLCEQHQALLMRALAGAGRRAEALTAYAAARQVLVSELGLEPSGELRHLHQSILSGDGEGAHQAAEQRVAPTPPAQGSRTGAGQAPDGQDEPEVGGARLPGAGAGLPGTGEGFPGTSAGLPGAGDALPGGGDRLPGGGAGLPGGANGFPGGEGARPQQLPPAAQHFTGRSAELRALTEAANSTSPGRPAVLVISGAAGAGKTALAVHWAHREAHRFTDGQLYVNLRGFDPSGQPVTWASALRGFLDALAGPGGAVPASPDAQAGLYRSLLAGKRMLIILDNARDPGQVRPLLPGSAGSMVLVTSRSRLIGLVAADDARPLALDVLPQEEARTLLRRRIGPLRAAAEAGAVSDIAALCGGLPLALSSAAARVATSPCQSLATLAAQLGDARQQLDALSTGDPLTSVRAVLSWSYHNLSRPAARLFRVLGLHPGPDISVLAAASAAAMPASQARAALSELTESHLLTEFPVGRYSFHDLLRAYASELAHGPELARQRRAITHRFLDHYLHSGHCAVLSWDLPAMDPPAIDPPLRGVSQARITGGRDALAWFRAERRVLLTVMEHAAENGFDRHVWQLGWALARFLEWQGHWGDWVSSQQAALAAARRLADLPAQARSHLSLGRAFTRLGDHRRSQSHYQRAIALFAEAGDQAGEALTHLNLCLAAEGQGHRGTAMDHARRALTLYEAIGHVSGQANALNDLGCLQAQTGEYTQALESCQRALVLSRECGDRYCEACALDSLGYAHHLRGSHRRAWGFFQQSLELFGKLGDRLNEAMVLSHLGDACEAMGNAPAAQDARQRSQAVLAELHRQARGPAPGEPAQARASTA